MNLKNVPYRILPIDDAREELRCRASNCAGQLARSVARRTSCGEAYPEYASEVRSEYAAIDDVLFYQQCRIALERCLANQASALRYRRKDDTVTTVCFRRLSLGRVKIWGLE